MKQFYQLLVSGLLLLCLLPTTSAQVEFKVELQPDNVTYVVKMRPQVTWNSPQNLTSTAQVTLKVETGGFVLSNLQSLQPSTSWSNNARFDAPLEDPNSDYLSFGMTSLGTMGFNYQTGVEIPMFQFQNTGDCTGIMELIDNDTDPFLPPNSQNANVGNQITTAGAQGDAYTGNYDPGSADCTPADCPIDFSVSTTNPSTCIAADGQISVSTTASEPVEYSINNGQDYANTATFNNLSAGNYNVLVRYTDGNCPSAEAANPIVLSAPASPVINDISTTRLQACGQEDGTITIQATSDRALEYSIGDGFQSSNIFTDLAAGIYPISVRNADNTCIVNGSTASVQTAIQPIITNVVTSSPNNCSADNGEIEIIMSDNANYEYSIDGGQIWVGDNTFTGLTAGTYAPRARANSCVTADSDIDLTAVPCNQDCTISYELVQNIDGSFQVNLFSDVTWTTPDNVTSSLQVTVLVPTGGFTVTDFTSLVSGVTWAQNREDAPNEDGSVDYISFALNSNGTSQISYTAGQRTPLFSFKNGGTCTSQEVSLMNNVTDPFFPPNSRSANVGQQLTTFGSGVDAEVCIFGSGAVNCERPDPCTIDPTDTDNDGICDYTENENGSDPNNPCDPINTDTDNDGVCDQQEINDGDDPNDACDQGGVDTDEDGICDQQEINDSDDPNDPCDPNQNTPTCDQDNDGLTNAEEAELGTDPTNPDTDDDNIADGLEVNAPYSDPLYPCDPVGADTDVDGICDAGEIESGTNPFDPCDPDNTDTDEDGICDHQERQSGSDPNNPCDPIGEDTDGDGFCDQAE
ncbi:MAG: hypothetical protein AB8G22_17480, partial [Saprospiraceae bacterium]